MATDVLLLDVNETLSDMSPLRSRLEAVGAPGQLVDVWFAATLREGFALTLSGAFESFAVVGQAVLAGMLRGLSGLHAPADEAAQEVLAGIQELPLHGDVAPALRTLASAGMRIVALTNGAAESTRGLLERGGVADCVELCLSIDDVRRWKPAPETYYYAARRCGVEPEQMTLVAVHPWDVAGAQRARLSGAWINRSGGVYPSYLPAPGAIYVGFGELAEAVAGPRSTSHRP